MSILLPEDLNLVYQAQLIKILDGDTVDMYVNLGMGQFVNSRVRLIDIDAPEIFGVKRNSREFQKGIEAKGILFNWFNARGPVFYLKSNSKGIYGRWLGEIWGNVGEQSLNDAMKTEGYESEYWGLQSQKVLIEDWFKSPEFHIWGKDTFEDGRSEQLRRLM